MTLVHRPKPGSRLLLFAHWLNNIPCENLMGATSIALILNLGLSVSSPNKVSILDVLLLSTWGLFLFIFLVFRGRKNRRFHAWQRFIAKYGIMPVVTGIISGLFLLDSLCLPSQALFFDNIRTKVNGFFTNSSYSSNAQNVINLAISVFEALMLVYIAYGVVRAIQAGREDEDWKRPLQLPLLVLFSVTAGDFAINLL